MNKDRLMGIGALILLIVAGLVLGEITKPNVSCERRIADIIQIGGFMEDNLYLLTDNTKYITNIDYQVGSCLLTYK